MATKSTGKPDYIAEGKLPTEYPWRVAVRIYLGRFVPIIQVATPFALFLGIFYIMRLLLYGGGVAAVFQSNINSLIVIATGALLVVMVIFILTLTPGQRDSATPNATILSAEESDGRGGWSSREITAVLAAVFITGLLLGLYFGWF